MPPTSLFTLSLASVMFFTIIPKVPKIMKNTGRYAIKARAYYLPVMNANTQPPIPVKHAKIRFENFSPIED
jgi:hypothetical protein